jgi:hypothetical protein
MNYVAPVALFLFFLGLMALQGRRRGNPYGDTAAPTRDQKRLARSFQALMVVAWALTIVALVAGDDLLPLLIPAGALIFGSGLAFQLDFRGLREAFLRLDSQSAGARFFGARSVTPYWGILTMIIGAGFIAGGTAAAVT